MKELTTRQVVSLIFFLMCITKFIVLPSLLVTGGGNGAYVGVFILMIIELLVIFYITRIINVNKDLTFYKLLEKTLGNFIAKLIFLLYAFYFFVKALLLIVETNSFFKFSFYSEFSPFLFVVTLLLLLGYMATLKIKTLARTYEILRIPFVASIIIVVAISFLNNGYVNSLPFLEKGTESVLTGTGSTIFWFGDFLLLLLFVGKIKQKPRTAKKIMFSSLAISVLITLFIFNFYNIFNTTASLHTLAISDVINAITKTNALFKIDWLIVFMWSVSLIYGTGLFAYGLYSFTNYVIKVKNKYYLIIPIFISLFLILYLINYNSQNIINFVTGGFIYFAGVMQYLIPMLIPILLKIYKKKEASYEK